MRTPSQGKLFEDLINRKFVKGNDIRCSFAPDNFAGGDAADLAKLPKEIGDEMARKAGDEPLSDDAYENLSPMRLFILQMKFLLRNKLAGKGRDHAVATTLAGAQYLLKSGKEPDPANPKHSAARNRRAAWAALLREDPSIEQYSVGMLCTTGPLHSRATPTTTTTTTNTE